MDTKKFLFVINDTPYGNERPYNAMRHAMNLVKREGVQVKVFLLPMPSIALARAKTPPKAITTSSAWSSPWQSAGWLLPEGRVAVPEVSGSKI